MAKEIGSFPVVASAFKESLDKTLRIISLPALTTALNISIAVSVTATTKETGMYRLATSLFEASMETFDLEEALK